MGNAITITWIFIFMSERLVGVIPHVVMATGRLGSRQYTLVVTSVRLIFARLGAPQIQEALAQSKARAKSILEKLAAGRVLTPRDIVEYCRRYFTMPPDSILGESQDNFAIPVEGITRIYIDHKIQPKDEDSSIQMDHYVMTIVSSVGENEYVIDADPQDLGILRNVLGDKVHGDGRVKPIRPSF
jgi:hypothetical protein